MRALWGPLEWDWCLINPLASLPCRQVNPDPHHLHSGCTVALLQAHCSVINKLLVLDPLASLHCGLIRIMHTHSSMHACTYTLTHRHTRTQTHTHACTLTHTHACTHSHTNRTTGPIQRPETEGDEAFLWSLEFYVSEKFPSLVDEERGRGRECSRESLILLIQTLTIPGR